MMDYNNFDPTSRRYIGMKLPPGCIFPTPPPMKPEPVNEVTLIKAGFKYNPQLDAICYDKITSKGKITSIPITRGFIINNVQWTYKTSKSNIENVILYYQVGNKSYEAKIPYKDYKKGKIKKHLPHIPKDPACNDEIFNEFLVYAIENAPAYYFHIAAHQGWNTFEDGTIIFAVKPNCNNILIDICPEGLLRREHHPSARGALNIINRFKALFSNNFKLKFLGLWRIGSSLLYFFTKENMFIEQYIILESFKNNEKLIAMLNTSNTKPINLECDEKALKHELGLVYDGIVVLDDTSFVDEAEKIENSLKIITKSVHRALKDEYIGRNLITIISTNAKYIATKLSSESVICMSMDDIQVEYDIDIIRTICNEMESYIVSTIQNNANVVTNFINDKIHQIKKQTLIDFPTESVNTLTMIIVSELFIRKFVGFSILNDDELSTLINDFRNKESHVENIEEDIIKDFAKVLSEMLRSGEYDLVEKRNNMIINTCRETAIVSGNRLLISKCMLEKAVELMRTTHNQKSLIKALERANLLIATDGKTHPIEAHNLSGEYIRLYQYDIRATPHNPPIKKRSHGKSHITA